MENNQLQQLIIGLIESHREDDWWDFKQEHYYDKADLIHDIICMANNRPRHDSYIILGVQDNTFEILGVENNPNRRNQQSIVDILRNTAFAGGVRPRIELQTIEYQNHELDILIIKDSNCVPYYLERPYQDDSIKNESGKKYGKIVRPFHIYTRVVDNNTAIDKQADINDIEYLWRKRFGIDLPIIDRLHILLDETDKWFFDWGNKKYCYHINFPEFQITQSEEMKQGWVPAAAFYTHPVMHLANLKITYHNTIIYETNLWSFDEFRRYLPEAQNCLVPNQYEFWYSYYLLDSIEGKLLKIFTNGNCNISSREPNYNQFLIFNDIDEKIAFDKYISIHFNDHSNDEINQKYKYQIREDNSKNLGGLIYSSFQVAKIAWLYEDWKYSI